MSMDPKTAARLLRLNRDFYDRFAQEFADTRGVRQPGLQRLAPLLRLRKDGDWLLDVGCGNGRLAHVLDADLAPLRLHYLGVDASAGLLDAARSASAGLQRVRASFRQIDVLAEGWTRALPAGQTYQAIAVLAVLHHLPGWQMRCQLLADLRPLLAQSGGAIALSTWQFLNSQRLRRKIVPWETLDLDAALLEPGDYLLDWQRGGQGLRYCHLVDEAELAALAAAAGLAVRETFYADGREGNLNLFAILQAGETS